MKFWWLKHPEEILPEVAPLGEFYSILYDAYMNASRPLRHAAYACFLLGIGGSLAGFTPWGLYALGTFFFGLFWVLAPSAPPKWAVGFELELPSRRYVQGWLI